MLPSTRRRPPYADRVLSELGGVWALRRAGGWGAVVGSGTTAVPRPRDSRSIRRRDRLGLHVEIYIGAGASSDHWAAPAGTESLARRPLPAKSLRASPTWGPYSMTSRKATTRVI